jgi:hypothetical protein
MEKNNEILNELKELNSSLVDISREMPYSLPENYHNEFCGNLSGLIKLENLNDKMPFEVPSDYFDDFPSEMIALIQKEEKKPGRIINVGWFGKNIRIAAAAIILLFAGAGIFQVTIQQNSIESQLSRLPEDAVSEYLQSTEGLELYTKQNNLGSAASQLSEDEIINYLDETGWQ